MIVVSDTSPINYLILVDAIQILPQLFDAVFIPLVVLDELRHAKSPIVVRRWADHPPPWLAVRTPKVLDQTLELDPGEIHAISLALELNAHRLLIDERAGTLEAERRKLRPLGTLGILLAAEGKRLIHVPQKLEQLQTQTNFRISPKLRHFVLSRSCNS